MTRALWVVEARNAYDPATCRRHDNGWLPTKPTSFSRAQARRYARVWRGQFGGMTRVVRYLPEGA